MGHLRVNKHRGEFLLQGPTLPVALTTIEDLTSLTDITVIGILLSTSDITTIRTFIEPPPHCEPKVRPHDERRPGGVVVLPRKREQKMGP